MGVVYACNAGEETVMEVDVMDLCAPRKVRDINKPVTVQNLAATIIEEIGQGQSDGWWFSSLPRVEALLLKYGYLLEKPDLLEKQNV